MLTSLFNDQYKTLGSVLMIFLKYVENIQ